MAPRVARRAAQPPVDPLAEAARRRHDGAVRTKENKTMRMGWIAVAPVLLFAAGCAQHSKEWDDAWAACQAEAMETQDTFEGQDDQRSEWEQNYISECMEKKGMEGQ
jgi:hypothetical protein